MPEPITLEFIARLLERQATDLRDVKMEQRFIHEELRGLAIAIARLEDTITMDLLERIRKLEGAKP